MLIDLIEPTFGANCKPVASVYTIPENTMIFPKCVKQQKCFGGCCSGNNHDIRECVATNKTTVKINVAKLDPSNPGKKDDFHSLFDNPSYYQSRISLVNIMILDENWTFD